eukprot:3559372-Prymnesium_polylepis.1
MSRERSKKRTGAGSWAWVRAGNGLGVSGLGDRARGPPSLRCRRSRRGSCRSTTAAPARAHSGRHRPRRGCRRTGSRRRGPTGGPRARRRSHSARCCRPSSLAAPAACRSRWRWQMHGGCCCRWRPCCPVEQRAVSQGDGRVSVNADRASRLARPVVQKGAAEEEGVAAKNEDGPAVLCDILGKGAVTRVQVARVDADRAARCRLG